jgi:hypothetical protein
MNLPAPPIQLRRRIESEIRARLGENGFQIFLETRQPDLADLTGRELLDGAEAQLLAIEALLTADERRDAEL